jgi:uncharacterized protein
MQAVYGVSDETAREILTSVRTIAVVGASPNPAWPSNEAPGFLIAKGFETYPVNPRRWGHMTSNVWYYWGRGCPRQWRSMRVC